MGVFDKWRNYACKLFCLNTTAAAAAEHEDGLPNVSESGYDLTLMSEEQQHTAADAEGLNLFKQRFLLNHAELSPCTGKTTDGSPYNNAKPGIYVGAIGYLPLFSSEAKYESGSGFASFTAPYDTAHVIERTDLAKFVRCKQVLDARSGAFLGHVTKDGPSNGKRYSIYAEALKFIPEGEPLPAQPEY